LKREIAYFEQKKTEELRVIAISPLLHFVIQMVSRSILNDPSNMPLIGYKLLPGLINVIELLKETFRVFDHQKDQNTPNQPQKSCVNLLDTLQALTNEGIDFARERIFETPHPYPQNEYSQSEQIEVPKAIGFIVELDRRCSAEHSSDQLQLLSGPDQHF